MTGCTHCEHCGYSEKERVEPQVLKSWSSKEGSCNFCMRHYPEGDYMVTVVKSPVPCGIVVRICDKCLKSIVHG